MKHIPTMTVNECVARLRALGIRMTEDSLIRGIQAGAYPFAISYRVEVKNRVEIYTVLFDRWVAERAVDLPENTIAPEKGGRHAELSA